MNFALDDKTLDLVEKSTGMEKALLRKTSLREVEGSCNSESFYLVKNPRERTSRGSVYLFLRRILSLDWVDKYLSRI